MAAILNAIARSDRPPALIGGRILPKWEAPLPPWWPTSLRGVLSIIEYEGEGEYRTLALPVGWSPTAPIWSSMCCRYWRPAVSAPLSDAAATACCQTRM